MTDQRPLRPFDIEGASPGFREQLRRYSEASADCRSRRACRLDVAYGEGLAEKLDIFLTDAPKAPIVVFIHGGGWRSSSKSDRSFPADVFCEEGIVWISVEYPLAPAATLDDMTACLRRSVQWIWRNAASFGGDPGRIYLCGNSAGGHLAGMLLGTPWTKQGMPADVVKGATTVSGVFEMVSHMHSPANEWLQLDLDTAVRNSPMYQVPEHGCNLVCAVGSNEPPEFIEQSEVYAAIWRFHGHDAQYLKLDDHTHFSIIGELGRHDSQLVTAMLRQIRATE